MELAGLQEFHSRVESNNFRGMLDFPTEIAFAASNRSDEFSSRRLPSPFSKVCFLELPFEIRIQIYRYVIPRNEVIGSESPNSEPREHTPDEPTKYPNTIFLMNHQTSSEALDILYATNTFHIVFHNKGKSYLRKNFSTQNIQRMQKIVITAGPYNGGYPLSLLPEARLWDKLLPNLQNLRFVVDQPLEIDNRDWESYEYEQTRTFEEKERRRCAYEVKLARWIEWIGGIARFFGERVEERTKVELDTNGLVETMEVFAKCFSGGVQEVVDFELGDYMYKRGRFSREVGYDSGEEWCCSLFD